MNYEKKYKNALGWMRSLYDGLHGKTREEAERYFPELKESESERISKGIKSILEHYKESGEVVCPYPFVSIDEALDWLEKQDEEDSIDPDTLIQQRVDALADIVAEQKSADKVEPKFKTGDWIVFNGLILHIDEIVDGYYRTTSIGGIPNSYDLAIDNAARLWTIQDAKEGDVLVSGQITILFNKFEEYLDYNFVIAYAGIDISGKLQITDEDWLISNDTKPAAKEQSDLLFQKMKEEGYVWDADKKELKKIHNALEECEIEHIEHGKYYYCIKDYFCGGRKQASKGDVVQALRGMSMMALGVKANEYFIPVNTIKQMSAWSENDETGLTNTIIMLKEGASLHFIKKDITKAVDWLKSLKDRVQHQSRWKPTEEQMKALKEACDSQWEQDGLDPLYTLYENLKKLI